MRHRKSGRGFGRDSAQRRAMFRNLVASLVLNERIHTTEAKAKELRRYAEKAITIARNAPTAASIDALTGADATSASAARVFAIRRARRLVNGPDALSKLFAEIGPRYTERPGGYTRIVKTTPRPGDNAEMAVIELVTGVVGEKSAPAAQEE